MQVGDGGQDEGTVGKEAQAVSVLGEMEMVEMMEMVEIEVVTMVGMVDIEAVLVFGGFDVFAR